MNECKQKRSGGIKNPSGYRLVYRLDSDNYWEKHGKERNNSLINEELDKKLISLAWNIFFIEYLSNHLLEQQTVYVGTEYIKCRDICH